MSDARNDFIRHVETDSRLNGYTLKPVEPADQDATIIRVKEGVRAVGDIFVSGRELRMNSGENMKHLAAARVTAFIIQRNAPRG